LREHEAPLTALGKPALVLRAAGQGRSCCAATAENWRRRASRAHHRRMQERRQHRSDDPSTALELLLEAHRVRLNLRALVVATPSGQLLAGAGHDPGAVAAMIGEDLRDRTEPTLATWRLRDGDRELVIGSLGGRLSHEVGDGVRRICPGT
jgi:hypothetical protein